jgi:hypothetical protein
VARSSQRQSRLDEKRKFNLPRGIAGGIGILGRLDQELRGALRSPMKLESVALVTPKI